MNFFKINSFIQELSMRSLLYLFLLYFLTACSQQSINRASYSAGKTARKVVEGAKSAYHSTVEGASQAIDEVGKGYSNAEEEDELKEKRQRADTANGPAQGQLEDPDMHY